MVNQKTRVLIVGGGFGGIKTALELSKGNRHDVTLLSDKPVFQFFPTLYHTATGGASAESSLPLSSILADKNIRFEQGVAKKLDRKKKTITTEDGKTYHFDALVIGLGSVPNYFGIQGIADYAYSIKTPEEAKRFKNHLHEQLTDLQQPDPNYVIVGGGPTGIELAGSLKGYIKAVAKAHGIRHKAVHVDLVEAAPKLVPRMPNAMSRAIARRLRRLGVRLYLGKTVGGETADSLMVDGKPIQSHTVVWTAGVTNHPFFHENTFSLNERGKVKVDEYLQAEPDIYVIGDNADTKFSGMAQTALYDGAFVGRNLSRQAKGLLMDRYKPKEPIYVIPVGPGWAAVLWGKQQFYGWIGWILRSLADLRGFKDYEPWWKAGEQWMTEFETEEDCPTCAKYTIS
jgi:NADH:quinone reductase (non-electrogenic)